MKKKLLAFIVGLSMVAAVTGCGKSEASNDMVSIGQYKGLKVDAVTAQEVTEEDIESSIAYTLEVTAADYAEEFGIKDRAAEEGDVVLIDYSGKVDGVVFEGGTAEKQTLGLGTGSFIDGFEDAIIGHMPGETFDINVTFPEEYGNEELNGKDAVFTIVLHSIVPTELTDEIATALVGAATTVEEYKEIVKNDLEVSNASTAEAEYENAVYVAFLNNCEMKEYPEDELEKWIGFMEDSYSMYAMYYGVDTDTFLQTYYGTTCEALAKEQILFKYATELVAEKEGMTLTLEEYENKIAEDAVNYGYESAEAYESAYDEYYGEGYLKNFILQEKVMDWLVENSVSSK